MTAMLDPGAIDPNTGQIISQTDPAHYNVLSIYYRLIPQYEREKEEALNGARGYLKRIWHDYAVLLIQTAQSLGIKTRPPGFSPAPTPPTIHTVTLTKDYQLQVNLIPACAIPPDPDPATDTLRALPLPFPGAIQEYQIVKIAPNAGFTVGGSIAALPTKDMLVAYLRALSQEDRLAVIGAVLA